MYGKQLLTCLVPYSEARRIVWNFRSQPRSLDQNVQININQKIKDSRKADLNLTKVYVYLLARQSTKLQDMAYDDSSAWGSAEENGNEDVKFDCPGNYHGRGYHQQLRPQSQSSKQSQETCYHSAADSSLACRESRIRFTSLSLSTKWPLWPACGSLTMERPACGAPCLWPPCCSCSLCCAPQPLSASCRQAPSGSQSPWSPPYCSLFTGLGTSKFSNLTSPKSIWPPTHSHASSPPLK